MLEGYKPYREPKMTVYWTDLKLPLDGGHFHFPGQTIGVCRRPTSDTTSGQAVLEANKCSLLEMCPKNIKYLDDTCAFWNNGAVFLLMDRAKSETKLGFEVI